MSMFKTFTLDTKVNNDLRVAHVHILTNMVVESFPYVVPSRVRIFKGGRNTSQILR